MKTLALQPVKSLETLKLDIEARSHMDRVELHNKIEMLNDLYSDTKYREAILFARLPKIVEALETLGLGIESMGYGKTGMNMGVWSPEDSLRVNITAVPTSNKFKFIKDQGFTAGGSGKNQKQLDAKAEKLQAFIKEQTNANTVHVNCFSLEVKNVGDKGSVSIELYIK